MAPLLVGKATPAIASLLSAITLFYFLYTSTTSTETTYSLPDREHGNRGRDRICEFLRNDGQWISKTVDGNRTVKVYHSSDGTPSEGHRKFQQLLLSCSNVSITFLGDSVIHQLWEQTFTDQIMRQAVSKKNWFMHANVSNQQFPLQMEEVPWKTSAKARLISNHPGENVSLSQFKEVVFANNVHVNLVGMWGVDLNEQNHSLRKFFLINEIHMDFLCNRSNVIIFTFGAHFMKPFTYREEHLERFSQWMKKCVRNKRTLQFVVMETFPIHFATNDDGLFPFTHSRPCGPIRNLTTQRTRNEELRKLAQRSDSLFLRTFDLLVDRWDAHTVQKGDCLHFDRSTDGKYSDLWAPLAESLATTLKCSLDNLKEFSQSGSEG